MAPGSGTRQVIDMGVMVPCENILDKAIEELPQWDGRASSLVVNMWRMEVEGSLAGLLDGLDPALRMFVCWFVCLLVCMVG